MNVPGFRLPVRVSVVLGLAALAVASLRAQPATALALTNAEGTLRISLRVEQGVVSYQVDQLDAGTTTAVLEPAPLGFTRTDADFDQGLASVSASETRNVTDTYTLVAGKRREIRSRGVERTFTFRNATGMSVDVTVRAYRDGVAFRYGLPGSSTQLLHVSAEATGFNLPDAARLWAQPYSKVDVWAPGYEADWVNGVPAGTPAPGPQGWALPLLFTTGKVWALITESALESSYFAVHLESPAPGGLYRARLPEAEETYGVGPQAAAITLPWVSPWRVVVVGATPGAINESTLVTDLARPSELKDTSWIKPGIASWSWWSDMSSPADYAKLVPFVDAAARFNWAYSLVDLGWDQMKNGGDIKRLADHAAKKNVGLIVWYNSAGRHNQVPDAGPKHVLNDPLLREAEFARIAALGIKGIKVDFMQSDKQFVIALYHDILRAAARHRLLVNFHGATIPRGWERTHPNLVTMEAVRGGEQYWDKTFAEHAHTAHTIYVFTRNAIGPMDYTPTVFTDPGASNPTLQRHLTTNAHELALLVSFQSGIQHVIDPAASLVTQPAFVQDYLTDLPAAWDESRVLAGSPGELAVVARRSGRTWYVSGINGLTTPRTVRVPLAFLGRGRFALSLITDGPTSAEFAHATREVGAGDTVEVVLAGRGGFAARLRRE